MRSERTLVVTGAAGFVGCNLVEALDAEDCEVVAFDLAGPPSGLVTGARWVAADLTAITDHVDHADVVIHLAAVTAGPDRERADAAGIVAVNVGGTQAVLDASRRLGAERFVYVSSGAVSGTRALGTEPVDEDTPPDPGTLYAATKLAGEHLTFRHGRLWDVPVIVARLGAVFGPWERPTGVRDTLSPFLALAERAAEGGHARVPRTAPRSWTYAPDVADALTRLGVGPEPLHDRYVVATPETVTIDRWAERLSAAYPDFTWELVEEDPDIPYDGDPLAGRAPVRSDRLRSESPGWPSRTTADAFEAYLSWLTTSASSATTP